MQPTGQPRTRCWHWARSAVEAGTDMDTYAGISAEVPQTYDEVLATKYNGEYFLIHLTEATIEVLVAGTTITITGEYKK